MLLQDDPSRLGSVRTESWIHLSDITVNAEKPSPLSPLKTLFPSPLSSFHSSRRRGAPWSRLDPRGLRPRRSATAAEADGPLSIDSRLTTTALPSRCRLHPCVPIWVISLLIFILKPKSWIQVFLCAFRSPFSVFERLKGNKSCNMLKACHA